MIDQAQQRKLVFSVKKKNHRKFRTEFYAGRRQVVKKLDAIFSHYEALRERRYPTAREAKLHTTLELHSLDKDISLLFKYDNTLDT